MSSEKNYISKEKGMSRLSAEQQAMQLRYNHTLAAVRQNPYVLRDAAPTLQADREIVLAAVRQDGRALLFAADALQADREIVRAAVEQNGISLAYADQTLQADREIVLAAVQTDAMALRFAARTLQADREIVLAAVQQEGRGAMLCVHDDTHEELRADREFMLAAVQIDGMVLRHAADTLRVDREIVLTAVLQNSEAIEYADDTIRNWAERMGQIEYVESDPTILLAEDYQFLRDTLGNPLIRTIPHNLLECAKRFMLGYGVGVANANGWTQLRPCNEYVRAAQETGWATCIENIIETNFADALDTQIHAAARADQNGTLETLHTLALLLDDVSRLHTACMSLHEDNPIVGRTVPPLLSESEQSERKRLRSDHADLQKLLEPMQITGFS